MKSRILIGSLSLFGLVFFSVGCATHSYKSPQRSTSPRPLPTAGLYQEVGLASWYGPGFYGRKTASGEKFKKNELTCAHRTLPFGTRLRVTNMNNDRAVEVRVNDRGPFIRNKIVDLSYAAAKEIGMLKSGSAEVELKTLVAQDIMTEESGQEDPDLLLLPRPSAPEPAQTISDLIEKIEKKE